MANKKRTRITVETERIFVLSKSGATRDWCAGCEKQVYAVGIEEAALLTGLSVPMVRRKVEDGTAHSIDTSAPPFICLNSLLK